MSIHLCVIPSRSTASVKFEPQCTETTWVPMRPATARGTLK